VALNRLLIDPGLGFGKTPRHNLELLRALPRFARLGVPVVIGASRKSFIGAVLGAEVPDRLPGSLACAARAFACGVQVVRVHDVKPTVQLLTMLEAIQKPRGSFLVKREAQARYASRDTLHEEDVRATGGLHAPE
jgi:dihydropteroate synthase